jgi:hypothetical protein
VVESATAASFADAEIVEFRTRVTLVDLFLTDSAGKADSLAFDGCRSLTATITAVVNPLFFHVLCLSFLQVSL